MIEFLKRVFGIQKLEEAKKVAEEELAKSQAEAEKAKTEEAIAKMTPKERATAKGEPWVSVLETHVNKDNIRNGFFELDWNEYFVLQLRQAGYKGETDEAVVDGWFQELCRNVGAEEGVDMSRRGAGYVNRALRDDGKTEVS